MSTIPFHVQEWTCPLCLTSIRRQHRARHMQSKGHRARSGAAGGYQVRDSDLAFSEFLAGVTKYSLSNPELSLYIRVQNAA